MSNLITVRDDAFFRYLPDQDKIIFISLADDSDYVFILKTKQYCSDINQLLTNKIDLDQFKLRLSGIAYLEFESAILELKRAGIVKSDSETAFAEDPGLLIQGDFFTVHIESLQEYNVASQGSEGEPCGPVGLTACVVNPSNTNYPRELWQCIASPDANWSAMGVSC